MSCEGHAVAIIVKGEHRGDVISENSTKAEDALLVFLLLLWALIATFEVMAL